MAAMHYSSSSMSLALLPLLLAAALAPSLASASPALDNGDELLMLGRFHGWMAAHGRSYATEEEKLLRFEIYRSNMEFIAAANRDSRMRYRLGETPFTDLTHDEFMAMYGGNGGDPSEKEEMMITTHAGPVHEGGVHRSDLQLAAVDEEEPPRRPNPTTLLPPSVDWRAEGVVTPVGFNGWCSSCWAFVAAATIESAQAISTGDPPPVLSEQQLVDCDTLDKGCGGGWMDTAFKWVIQNGGITSAAAYPYTDRNGTCQEGKPAEVTLSGYKRLPRGDEAAIMEAVARQPVAVAFDHNDPCFQHYIDGVYDGKCFASGVYVGGACGTNQTHGLALVGYGTMPGGTKYWIGKNSWSARWGDNGFVYVLRDSPPLGLCGLAVRPSFPII
ncbi:ervatamin-B [Setaria italica]|nr:ervatamin-B [Setaria italica]